MPHYRVEVAATAERELRRLSGTLLDRIFERVDALAIEPRPPGSQKLVSLDAHRIRVGDYRILYRIDDAAKVIVVTRIRHRRDVYRRLR